MPASQIMPITDGKGTQVVLLGPEAQRFVAIPLDRDQADAWIQDGLPPNTRGIVIDWLQSNSAQPSSHLTFSQAVLNEHVACGLRDNKGSLLLNPISYV